MQLHRKLAISLALLSLTAACSSSDESGRGGPDDDDHTTAAGGTSNQGGDPGLSQGGAGAASSTGGQGQGGEEPFECGEDVYQASLEKLPADLIIAVDNSDSMTFEAGQVKTNMTGLVGALTATGIDAHVVLISKPSTSSIISLFDTGVCLPAPVGSGNCPADENLPAYRHVTEEVDSYNALDKIISTYDQYKGSLRPNATKTFLVVSDDDATMTAADFTTALAGLNPPISDYKFNAVVASETPLSCALCAFTGCSTCANPCCDKALACAPMSSEIGQTYMDLQNQTMGVYGDLCSQNFAPVFANMATAVINHTLLSCSFDMPTPANGVIVPSETNVDFVPSPQSSPQPMFNVPGGALDCTINGGWYFDSAQNPSSITLCPTTCQLVQQSTEGSIRVKYGCTTQTTPN